MMVILIIKMNIIQKPLFYKDYLLFMKSIKILSLDISHFPTENLAGEKTSNIPI